MGVGEAGWLHPNGSGSSNGGGGGASGDRILREIELSLASVNDEQEGYLHFRGRSQDLPTFETETTTETTYTAPASDATPDSTIGTTETTQQTNYVAPASDATPDSTIGGDGTVTETTYNPPANDATPDSIIGTTVPDQTVYNAPASDATPDSTIGSLTYPQPNITLAAESVIGGATPAEWTKISAEPTVDGTFDWADDFSYVLFNNDDVDGTYYRADFDNIASGKWVYIRKDADNYLYARLSNVGISNSQHVRLNPHGAWTLVGSIADNDRVQVHIYAATEPTTVAALWNYLGNSEDPPATGNISAFLGPDRVQVHYNDLAGADFQTALEAIAVGKWLYLRKDADNYIIFRVTQVENAPASSGVVFTLDGLGQTGTVTLNDDVSIEVYTGTETTQVGSFVAATWNYDADTSVSPVTGNISTFTSPDRVQIHHTDLSGVDREGALIAAGNVGKWLYLRKDADNYIRGRITQSQNSPEGTVFWLDSFTTIGTVANDDDLSVEIYTGTETTTETTVFVAANWNYDADATGAPANGDLRVIDPNEVQINHSDLLGTDRQTALEGIEVGKWLYLRKDAGSFIRGRITELNHGSFSVLFRLDNFVTIGTVANEDLYIEIYTGTTETVDVPTFVAATWNYRAEGDSPASGNILAVGVTVDINHTDLSGTDREAALEAIAVGKWLYVRTDASGAYRGRITATSHGDDSVRITLAEGSDDPNAIGADVYIEIYTGTETTTETSTIVETAPSENITPASVAGNAHNLFAPVQIPVDDDANVWSLGGLTPTFSSDSLQVSFIGNLTCAFVAREGDTTEDEATSTIRLDYKNGAGAWTAVGTYTLTYNDYQRNALAGDVTAIENVALTSGADLVFRLVVADTDVRVHINDAKFEIYYSSKTARSIDSEFNTEFGISSDGDIDWTSHALSEDETGSASFTGGTSASVTNAEHDILTAIPAPDAPSLPAWNDIGTFKVGDPNSAGNLLLTEHSVNLNINMNDIDLEGQDLRVVVGTEFELPSEVRIYKDSQNYIELTTNAGVTSSHIDDYFFNTISAAVANVTEVGTVETGDTVRLQKNSNYSKYFPLGGFRLASHVVEYIQNPTSFSVTFNSDISGTQGSVFLELQVRRNGGNWVRLHRWTGGSWVYGETAQYTFPSGLTDTFVQGDSVEYRLYTRAQFVTGVSGISFHWTYSVDVINEISKQVVDSEGYLILCPDDFPQLWSGQVSAIQTTDTLLNAGEDFSEWKMLGFVWGHAASVQKTEAAPTQFWGNDDNTKVYLADNVHMTVQRRSDTAFRVTFVTGTIILQQIIGLVRAGSD